MKRVILLILLMAVCMVGCSKNTLAEGTTATEKQSAISTEVFTVTFLNYDGSTLSVQSVSNGQMATEPEPPEQMGMSFIGWDRKLEQVCSNVTVRPLYIPTTEPAVSVVSTSAAPGEAVTVPVVIVNNPGIAGAKITVIYDPVLTLTEAESGPAFAVLDYTGPGRFGSPCNFTWDSEKSEATENGDILYMTFNIPDNVAKGQCYEVKCAYQEGNIYDEELQDVYLQVFSGTITVT